MLNKTKRRKIAAQRLHKTLARTLYVLLPFGCKWLPILKNIRMRQTAPCKEGTSYRKFWEKDD